LRPIVTFAGSATSPGQFPRDGLPEVAFLGRSNVGKSSLLNALIGVSKLARVSSTPGRTRLVNFFRVGDDIYLADLPGYGYARVPESMRREWEGMVTSYLVDRAPLCLSVLLVDLRHDPSAGDEMMRDWLEQQDLPYVVAATKADKLSRGEAERKRRALEARFALTARGVFATSATTRAGIDELWKTVRTAALEARR
jgi:GTP-binding protein